MAKLPNRRRVLRTGLFLGLSPFLPAARLDAAGTVLPMREVAEGIYVFGGKHELMDASNQGEICNVGFVVGNDAVAVVDSGGSVVEGRALIAAVRAVTDRPIRYLVNTHMHPDHIFGNTAFADIGTQIVGHRNLPRALANRGAFYLSSYREAMGRDLMRDIRIVPPDVLVETERELELGGRSLVLKAWKPAHTDNDLTVFDGATRTLFAGDLCFMEHLPTLDGSIRGWIEQLQPLAAIGADQAVPGHGPVAAKWPDALQDERRYFEAVVRDVRKAIAGGVPMAEAVDGIAPEERGRWRLFDEHHLRNATAAFAELEWE
ncbi:quinoprotein relay system zinc metallohydrolase 2 [Ciceribacter azotifigens]|uniref:quinoprotein relay system zinc metallohydrolase 2 n=1 Tax=Ciceribacter azotifigens TaxID=2069303 RepID=UPI003A8872A5